MDRRAFFATGALFAVAGATGARAQPAGRPFTVEAQVALDAYRSLVEEHLTGVLRALRALAGTSDLQSGRWARIRPALQRLNADTPTAAAVWFGLPDGGYWTAERGRVAENVSDRAYFPGLMGGADVEGFLVISKSTGHRSIVVAAPVRRNGKVIGALGMSVRARFVSEMVERAARLPDDLVFYALDAKGQTAIHKDPARMFEHPSDMGDPSLSAAVKTILSQPRGVVDYEFRASARTAIFDRSELTGWSFVLAKVRE